MKFYDIHGKEMKNGDTIIMGDPLYPLREEFKIKEINGILHYCWANWKVPMKSKISQMGFDICEAELKS